MQRCLKQAAIPRLLNRFPSFLARNGAEWQRGFWRLEQNPWVLNALIVLIALLWRTLWIEIKPPHFDEGINGWFVDQMRSTGYYDYDPSNYHGPFHFYTLFVSLALFGRDLLALRLPAILASTLSVACVLRFSNIFPANVCRMAALMMAVSPAYTFYGRYSIHESWLLLFCLLTVWGILTLWKVGSERGLWAAGLGITGMILTKETYVIHLGCLLLSWPCLTFYERFVPARPPRPFALRRWDADAFTRVLAVSLGSILFFYSGTFLNWGGISGLFLTFQEWIKTGIGPLNEVQGWKDLFSPAKTPVMHAKPFTYWLELMLRLEPMALAGLLCCFRYLLPGNRLLRFLAIYGAGCLLAYSLISYKTPWCIIVILWPFYLLFSAVLVELTQRNRCFACLWILPAAGLVYSNTHSFELNFYRHCDGEHPYVYVQTYPSIERVVTPLEQLGKLDPQAFHLPGHVMMESAFPLPWMLGDFTQLGYYPRSKEIPRWDVAILIVDESRILDAEVNLRENYFTEIVKIRNGMSPVKLYLREAEFRRIYPDRIPEFTPRSLPEGPVEIRRAIPVWEP